MDRIGTMSRHFVRVLMIAGLLALPCLPTAAAGEGRVRHPNLLLNRDEIEQVKAKVQREAWAAQLLERLKALADDNRHSERELRDAAVDYALTGDNSYAERVRRSLLGTVRSEMPKYAH